MMYDIDRTGLNIPVNEYTELTGNVPDVELTQIRTDGKIVKIWVTDTEIISYELKDCYLLDLCGACWDWVIEDKIVVCEFIIDRVIIVDGKFTLIIYGKVYDIQKNQWLGGE